MQGLDFVANITVTAVDPSKPEPTTVPEPSTPPTPTTTDDYVPPVPPFDPEDPPMIPPNALCEKDDPWWWAEGDECRDGQTVPICNVETKTCTDHIIRQQCVIANRQWNCTNEKRRVIRPDPKFPLPITITPQTTTTAIPDTTTTTQPPIEPPLATTTATIAPETTTTPIPDATTTLPSHTTLTTTIPSSCQPPLPTLPPPVCGDCDKEILSEGEACNRSVSYRICKMVDGAKKYAEKTQILVCTLTSGEWQVTTNTTTLVE